MPSAPIIDVHLHAYPLDGVLGSELTNPATGAPGSVADGAAHLEAYLAQMRPTTSWAGRRDPRLNTSLRGGYPGGGSGSDTAQTSWRP